MDLCVCLASLMVLLQAGGHATKQQIPSRERQAEAAYMELLKARKFPFLESERHLYDLLRLRPIRKELRIDLQAYQKIQSIKAEADRVIVENYNSELDKGAEQAFLASQFDKRTRFDSIAAIRQMLTEEQRARLRQLALYCEIDYLGLDLSLTEGVLGQEAGVTENQRTHLQSVARRALAEERSAVLEAQVHLHDSVIAALDPAEKSVAASMLGRFFNFYQGRWTAVRDRREDLSEEVVNGKAGESGSETDVLQVADTRGTLVAWDAGSIKTKYGLLFNSQVQRELGLNQEQVNVINAGAQFTADLNGSAAKEFLREAQTRMDEIITPIQQQRLDQISQYLVVASYGYARYLTSGHFAEVAGIGPERATLLSGKIRSLEAEYEKTIATIKKRTLDNVLRELSTEQRSRARSALGEFFCCPPALFAHRRESVDGAAGR